MGKQYVSTRDVILTSIDNPKNNWLPAAAIPAAALLEKLTKRGLKQPPTNTNERKKPRVWTNELLRCWAMDARSKLASCFSLATCELAACIDIRLRAFEFGSNKSIQYTASITIEIKSNVFPCKKHTGCSQKSQLSEAWHESHVFRVCDL